jgi:general secretion pathway protein C
MLHGILESNRFNDNRRMVSNSRNSWAVAGISFVLWGLVAASAVYWGLKLTEPSRAGAANPLAASNLPPVDPAAVGRLLGAVPNAAVAVAPPVHSLASRFALMGVVASRSHQGAALISMDGKPAKPFRVGTTVEEGLILQSVESKRAILAASADGPPKLTLELPPIRK